MKKLIQVRDLTLVAFVTKGFGEKGAANKHELIHRDEKRYGCNFCDKKFIQSSNAKKHEMIHMNKNVKM